MSKSNDVNTSIKNSERIFARMKELGRNGHGQNNPDTIVYNALMSVFSNQVSNLVTQRNHSKNTDDIIETGLAFEQNVSHAFKLCDRMETILEEMVDMSKKTSNKSVKILKHDKKTIKIS